MSCIFNSLCPWTVNTDEVTQPGAYDKTKKLELDLQQMNSDIDQIKAGLNGILFLPDRKHRIVSLIYLTMINNNNGLSPFTERQELVFRVSADTDVAATRCLTVGGVVNISAAVVSCGAVGPGCFAQSWVLETVAIVGNAIGSTASYLSTGCYPHMASVKDNEKQNLYHELEGIYEELGIRLIRLSEQDPHFAKAIANGLQIDTICTVMKKTLLPEEATALVKPLKKAKKFVVNGKRPTSPPSIHNCVENVLLRREFALLRGLIEVRMSDEIDLDLDVSPNKGKNQFSSEHFKGI